MNQTNNDSISSFTSTAFRNNDIFAVGSIKDAVITSTFHVSETRQAQGYDRSPGHRFPIPAAT